jgi:hypothetical protein
MREYKMTSVNKEYASMLWFVGSDHYFIYNPLAEALRMYADYIEGIEQNQKQQTMQFDSALE